MKDQMNNQLEELRKWSESVTRTAWDGFFQAFKGVAPFPPPAAGTSVGDTLSRLTQLNQLTLSMMEQFRYWEKLNEQIKGFSESLLSGLSQKPDRRIEELTAEIDQLKVKLDSQEALLKELQAKLRAEESLPGETGQTTRILSEFLSEQTRQFKKLVKAE